MMQNYKYYRVKIDYHRTDDLRPEALPNGTEVIVQAMWRADDDEQFAGDMILQPAQGLNFPERDAVILCETTHDEYLKSIQTPNT